MSTAKIRLLGALLPLSISTACEGPDVSALLGEDCSLDSDCANPNICVFERCHEPCNEDRDCDGEERCVRGIDVGVNVCQLPDEVACDMDKDCPGAQVCGIDLECRDSCITALECTPTQLCAVSQECASTDPTKDIVDANGNIVPTTSATTGATDTTGTGGTTSDSTPWMTTSGEATTTLGTTSEAGTTSSEITSATTSSSSSAEATSEGPGTTAATTEAEATTAVEGTTEIAETTSGGETSEGQDSETDTDEPYYEPDETGSDWDSREQPIPLITTASIYLPQSDNEGDWLEIPVPPTGAEEYLVELEIQQAVGLQTQLRGSAALDDSEIGTQVIPAASTGRFYFSVAPETNVLLRITRFGSSSFGRAELVVSVTPGTDVYEPNNDRFTATVLSPGDEITATAQTAYVDGATEITDDWYEIDLAPAPATVQMDLLPSAGRLQIQLLDGSGVIVESLTTAEGQFSAQLPADDIDGGTHYVVVRPYATTQTFAVGAPHPQMVEPYTLRVVQ